MFVSATAAAVTEPNGNIEEDDRIEKMLAYGEGFSVIIVIPVADGTLESVGPVQRPEEERSVVVVDGNIFQWWRSLRHAG